MISPLRATAIVGVGTVVTLTTSVVVAKMLALLIGPAGVGLYGLLQSVLGLVTLVAGLGVSTGIVRAIAAALAGPDDGRVVAIQRAGLLIGLSAGTLGALALIALREPIADGALGSGDLAPDVVLIAPAVVLHLVAGVELGILNGYHRVRELTIASAAASALGGGLTIGLVAALGERGIAASLLVSAMIALVVSGFLRVRTIGFTSPGPDGSVKESVRLLLRFGGPYTASQLAGVGVQLLIPIFILGQVGAAGVGHYRAAATIGIGYLAFLLNAMAQDYLPRVAGALSADLPSLIERRTRLVAAIAAPIILVMLALAPVAVVTLYTPEFMPAADVLQWQLIGDLLKLPAWALSFVVLARASSLRFLGLELIGGAALICGVLILTPALGVTGAGVAYLLSYVVYYVAAWLLVQRVVRVAPGRLQVTIVALTVGCIVVLIVLRGLPEVRTIVLLLIAAAIAGVAWPRLWRHHRQGALV